MKGYLTELQAEIIGRVWKKMTATYGHKWISAYGDVDGEGGKTWLQGLQEMLLDEIKTGLNACVNRADAWPPSLPEFRALCRPGVSVKPACHRDAKPYAALPKPEKITAPGDARAHLASIMEKLGGRCGKLEPRKNRIDPVSADRRAELAAELCQYGCDVDRGDAA